MSLYESWSSLVKCNIVRVRVKSILSPESSLSPITSSQSQSKSKKSKKMNQSIICLLNQSESLVRVV